eukprot:TRINITY_DN3301_c0_g1_i1.p1 TRINITY_DN3301_c0_g1~~TRINITY_DN3301_c0_g1_i1.p1  ORF type:complete len:367 (+),score=114.35 TRINITY_DN3301_c0_g1_i1:104-1204(+)
MDVADEKQNLGDFVAINGEEEEEEFVEEEIEEEEETSERDGGINSAGEEMKHGARSDSSSSGKIFVGGVAWETTEVTFLKHFKKYGEITDSVIMRDKRTNKPRGFGFITFADPSVVEKVLEEAHVIDGRTVEVKQTVPREEMTSKGGGLKTKKLFVGGIPPTLTEDELKEYFSSYGTVVENQIMLDHSTGRSRGFGFVTFESDGTVEELISEGKTHEIGGKQVEIKKAEPKRPDGDLRSNGRAGYGGGGGANSYGGYGGGAFGHGGGFKSGGGYGGRMGGSYGGYGGGYNASSAGAYGGYGGYGYGAGFGAGFGGAMYGGAEYGVGDRYGSPGGYGGAYATGGGYGGSRGYGSGGAANGRYHPYGR